MLKLHVTHIWQASNSGTFMCAADTVLEHCIQLTDRSELRLCNFAADHELHILTPLACPPGRSGSLLDWTTCFNQRVTKVTRTML